MVAAPLTERERILRDRFVFEYVKDGKAFEAAQRVGFLYSFAAEYAHKFLNEPYVQQRIGQLMLAKDKESRFNTVNERAIEDFLLHAMRNPGTNPSQISAANVLINFYKDARANIPGNTPQDTAAAIHAALREMDESTVAPC